MASKPLYRGVGCGLLAYAVCHSYILGLGGRINLSSLPSERTRNFYEERGFISQEENAEGLIDYELNETTAQGWLKNEGYLS